jgi:hypothetical protein
MLASMLFRFRRDYGFLKISGLTELLPAVIGTPVTVKSSMTIMSRWTDLNQTGVIRL